MGDPSKASVYIGYFSECAVSKSVLQRLKRGSYVWNSCKGGGLHLELCKVVPFVVLQRWLLFVRVRRVSCVYYGIVSTCFYSS